MELTYKELQKRDVINVVDGRCLGRIIDARFDFPRGILIGIYLPARKNKGIFSLFDKSTTYIDVRKIKKIGGDVILVEIACGGECSPNTPVGKPDKRPPNPPCPPQNPCAPPCPPQHCQTPFSQQASQTLDLNGIFDENGRLDLDDY